MDDSFQEILDLVLKASNEGIWDWNVGSDSIYYSEKIYEFFGYEGGEAPNFMKCPEAILEPEDVSYLQHILDLVLMDEDEELFAVDCKIKRPDKQKRWIRIRGVVVREGGEATRIVGSIIDITKRKTAEAALEEKRTMLRLVVDNVPVQVYFKDVNSQFCMVNKRQAQWLGCESEEELLGKTDANFYQEETWKQSRKDELRIMETGVPIVGAVQAEKWKDKADTFVQVVKQPWHNSQGGLSGTFGVSTDVTVIFESQAKLEVLAMDLQARNNSFKEELGLAREVQQALLPGNDGHWEERLQCVKGLAVVDKQYIPATELAGDYYDVLPLGDGRVGLFICDVMGHGVRSALVVSMIRGLMEKAEMHADRPAIYLEKINRGLCRIFSSAETEMFATACYVVADFKKGTMRVACAGHDYPLLAGRKDGELLPCTEPKGPALGFFSEARYKSSIFKLSDIAEALLFTDGVYESSSHSGEEWGRESFEKSFVAAHRRPEVSSVESICEDASDWVGGKGFDDDVCLLSIRIDGAR